MKWHLELYAMQKEVELHMMKLCSPVVVDVLVTLAVTWAAISIVE